MMTMFFQRSTRMGYFILLLWVVYCTLPACSVRPKGIQPSDYSFQVAFYNVENFFDTISSGETKDEDFTPLGKQKWGAERYGKKISDLVTVFDSMRWPEIIGLAEIENRSVLEDLIDKMPSTLQYEIAHFDSPDERGIDVALLYRSDRLRSLGEHAVKVDLPSDAKPDYTRDILYAVFEDQVGGDTLHCFVNHWPSRVGGKQETSPKRMFAASVLRNSVEALWSIMPTAHIVIMGDFNDTPVDASLQYILGAKSKNPDQLLVNLSEEAVRSGQGTYNYRGNWDMLDQIVISKSLLSHSSLSAISFEVFNRSFLLFEHERYGLSPNRTYGGPNYFGGYSDHLPVRMYANIKKSKDNLGK